MGITAIPDYEIIEKIAEAPHSAVFKAYHKKNPDRFLVIKLLKSSTISELQRAQFRQKIEHLKVLNDTLVITPLSFESKDEVCFLTQEYFAGVTLDKLIEARSPFSLKDFFIIACGVARALEIVHQAGIIHGGVKTHNILVNPEMLDVRLTDFISTIDVQDVSHFIYEPSFIKGTLAYTSPEQTGRINHRVVFASDLYSLGIVFYEMLTSKVPFLSDDPLELIHAHLAREAPTVHELNHDIPPVLGKIVAKLMLKEPEKRYQSSGGLLADLIRCKDEYTAIGTIREFPLETSVPAHRVAFISKMVGRDREAKFVLDEYEQVTSGAFRAMFISGLPGIGKTRLIQELQKPMVQHRGYFTSGKFDIYQKNIPYSSLTQALRNLVHTFLTESNERVALWKDRILQAVGQNGKVMTDVVLELEMMIGKQPDVQLLPPVESLHRFHDVCGRFLTCLATKEHPLIIFIDDLQWCDAASFDFLAEVFHNYQDHQYLFLLGAYRHNEVDSSHPLARLIHNVRETNRPLKEIRLDALKPEHCHEMVSYILDSPPEQTWALAQYLSVLTEGNPLFVSESLAYLYNEGLLYLDNQRQWQWDITRIRESRMPSTVVNLFSSKIQKLQPDLVNLLRYCACIGNIISPAELSSIKELPLQDVFETLKPALEQGLVIENRGCLQFLHDRVQEAVLSGIPEERRSRMHWEIGTRLRAQIPESTTDYEKLDNLFAIVAHLNLGIDEKPSPETAYFVLDLNYHAGNKALDSLAIEAANKYFNRSLELLPGDCWEESRYERTFEIFRKTAKTELMCGNYEKSEKLLNELLGHAKTDLDRAECLAEQTVSLSSIGNYPKAIETANRGLAYFGKAIPASLDEVNKKREELMAEIAAKNIDIRETLLNMPFTTDRKKKVESAFYSELLADLYFSRRVPELYFVGAQATLHCLEGGMDEGIIYGFTVMGLYYGEQEEFELSFMYEDLTHDLAAKYPNTFAATKCMNGATWTMMHTRSHPRDVVEYSLKAFQCGKSCGDINNAAIAYGPVMWNLQTQGAELEVIEDYARECLQFANRYRVPMAARLAEATQTGWIAPMKRDFTPVSMEETLEQWERDNHSPALANYCMHRAQAHYYFGEYEEAERELARAKEYVNGVTNSVLKRGWHVFKVLNTIKLYEKSLPSDSSRPRVTGSKSKRKLMTETKSFIAKIEKWVSYGPVFKPYLAFIYAELERVTGNPLSRKEPAPGLNRSQGTGFREARSLYLDAIDAANEQEYTFLAGHLNECLGELLMLAGQHSEAGYFAEAARLYQKCGAERKEIRLLEKSPAKAVNIATTAAVLPELDIEYLMKSSLAISAEIEQAALLDRIMKVVIESSGAQHGYLLIQDEGNLIVRAGSSTPIKEAQKLDDAAEICKAIVRYVHRTGERVILDEACREGIFKDNPEVQDRQLRSVLCLPVVKQARPVGILYLENHLAGSIFTPNKVKMTELLASQAAVSLDNARLIEREQFLANLVRNASVAMATGYTDGRLGTFNPAFQKLTGYTEEELRSITWNKALTPPEWRESEAQKLAELHHTKEPVQYEKEYIHKNGSRIAVELVVHPFFDDAGNISSYFAFISDITQRKQAEEAILRAKEEWELTFNTVPDLMMILDKQHRIVRVNKATAERLGLAPEQCVGVHCYEAVHGMPYPPQFCPHALTCQDGKEHSTDVHEPRLGGDFLVSTTPMHDGNGTLTGSIHVARDITERKRAEENLKFLEKSGESITASLEYETILSNVPKLVVPAIADWCVVHVVGEDGLITLAVVHHLDPTKVKWAYELNSAYPLDPNAPIGAPAVIRTGKPEVYADISDSMLKSIAKNDEELKILRSVGYASVMIVPLRTPKKVHGCITLVSAESSRHYNDSDLMLAIDLARKIAISIENARLYQYQLRAEEELRKAHDELELRVQERTRELTEANRMLQAEMLERERAQQAITAERQRFNEVLDMLPVYAILLTPNHHVPFANRFFEERFGGSHGKRCYEYLFNRTEPCEICETFTVLKTQKPHHWEWLGPDKHNYDIFDFPFTDTDGSALIMEVGVDITEVKRAEAALQKAHDELELRVHERTAELEAANKELEAFSYSVSHDLRAPLRHMDGFSRLVLEGYADKLDDQGKEYLQIVRSSSELMATLIDDLLNLSRITRVEIHLEKVNLSNLADEVAVELKETQPEREVDFIITPGLEARGDRQLLKLVFDNLLGNAFKFTSKRPKARIEFGVSEHNGEQSYFVRDNGAGFDMTYADKLFRPFQRLHRAEDFPGTGIGLASVHRIISRLGGKVRAEGEMDKGAIFYFTLR